MAENQINGKRPLDEGEREGEEKECSDVETKKRKIEDIDLQDHPNNDDEKNENIAPISCLLCLETSNTALGGSITLNSTECTSAPLPPSTKIISSHSCSQCKSNSWYICNQCEASLYSKSCPVCRGDYAPLKYYFFPDLTEDHANYDPILYHNILNLVKISLIQYEKIGVWCPNKSGGPMIHFSFPQDTTVAPKDMEFLHVSLPITNPEELNRLQNIESNKPAFLFTNSIWDRLDEILQGNDTQNISTEETHPSQANSQHSESTPAIPPDSTLDSPIQPSTTDTTSEQNTTLQVEAATVAAEDEEGEDDSNILGIKETFQKIIAYLSEDGAKLLTPLDSLDSKELIDAYLSNSGS